MAEKPKSKPVEIYFSDEVRAKLKEQAANLGGDLRLLFLRALERDRAIEKILPGAFYTNRNNEFHRIHFDFDPKRYEKRVVEREENADARTTSDPASL